MTKTLYYCDRCGCQYEMYDYLIIDEKGHITEDLRESYPSKIVLDFHDANLNRDLCLACADELMKFLKLNSQK